MASSLCKTSIDHYLGTNYAPNIDEIKEVKLCISGKLQRLQAIKDEAALLELRIECLHEESAEIQASIDGHLALLSPIRQLPVELLPQIFIACLPTDRNPTMCNDEAPMLLTVICSHWRRVALSTPRIWAAIHIPIPQPECIPESPPGEDGEDLMIQRRCNGVKEFLSRSGSLPLMISIYFNGLWGSSVSWRTTAPIKIIIPFAVRWKDISIAGPSSAFSPIRELQSDFPPTSGPYGWA